MQPSQHLAVLFLTLFLFPASKLKAQDSSKPAPSSLQILVEDSAPRYLGIVRPNSDTAVRIEFENTTDATLEVEDVTASCGCTTASVFNRTLAPEKSTWVDAAIHAGQLEKNVAVRLTVQFRKQDDAQSKFVCHYLLAADILPECKWSTSDIAIHRITPSKPCHIEATNFGSQGWRDVTCFVSDARVTSQVELREVTFRDSQRQVAEIKLSLVEELKEPLQCVVALYSREQDVLRKISATEVTLETPSPVEIAPKKPVINEKGMKVFLICTDASNAFTSDQIECVFPDGTTKICTGRMIGKRWMELKLDRTEIPELAKPTPPAQEASVQEVAKKTIQFSFEIDHVMSHITAELLFSN